MKGICIVARFRTRRNRLFTAAAVFMFLACLGDKDRRLTGNGSEVENAIVVGRVVLASGEADTATDVTLYPIDYDAMAESLAGRSLDPAFTARTDSTGAFKLQPPDGEYNLWGHQPAEGRRFLIQGVKVESMGKVEAGTGILNGTGRLRITLPEGSGEGGYIYVPGTPLAVSVDGAADSNGTLLLDSIPGCLLNSVWLARNGKINSGRVLGSEVLIIPGATSYLPYTEWSHSAWIRVNPNGVPAKRVLGIPLLLRITGTDFDFSQARGDGSDIRFTTENGRVLPVHVQSWDSAGGAAAVWVKLDTVQADSSAQRIRMHWGNARAPAGKISAFDSANGYVGVWHLDSAPVGTIPAFADVGPAANAAKAMGVPGMPETMPAMGSEYGVIGGGVLLDGKGSYLMASRDLAGPSRFTASFWFRTSSKEGGKMLGFVMPGLKNVTYGSKPGNFNFDRVVWMTDEGLLHAGFTMRSANYPAIIGTWQSFTAATPYNDGKWHHLAYTLWDSGAMLMVDGIKVAGYTGLVRPVPEPGHWRIGYSGEGMWYTEWTSEYFQGSVDEVRFVHEARGEDWLRLEYESQKPGSAVLSFDKTP